MGAQGKIKVEERQAPSDDKIQFLAFNSTDKQGGTKVI
jgi:hypothetical protein